MAASKPSPLRALFVEPTRMVGGLWAHRELIWKFTHRAIEVRHRGSRLGPLWALVNPLSMLVLYFIVFGRIYGTRFGVLPGETEFDFSLALFLGLSLFHVFTETLSASPAMITGNPNFVKKVVFPSKYFRWPRSGPRSSILARDSRSSSPEASSAAPGWAGASRGHP